MTAALPILKLKYCPPCAPPPPSVYVSPRLLNVTASAAYSSWPCCCCCCCCWRIRRRQRTASVPCQRDDLLQRCRLTEDVQWQAMTPKNIC